MSDDIQTVGRRRAEERAGRLDEALARLRKRHAELLDTLERPTRPDLAAERCRILGEVEQLIIEYECLRARSDFGPITGHPARGNRR